MIALLLISLIPILMWTVQTIQLRHYGLPIRWRIDAGDAPRPVRNVGRAVTQVALVSVILCYPILRGQSIQHYYASLLPPTRSVLLCVHGAAASMLFLCVLYLVWIMTDRLRVSVHQSRRRWVRRLILLLPTAVFGAFVEELLFRGVVMADFLHTDWVSPEAAVAVATLVFAGAHYVRSVKRRWTIFGHLMLGWLLCVAFLQTKTLWLAIGLHAGGIMMIMGTRPFFRYRGPAWVTGASIFPFAGVVGIAGLGILTAFIANYYGGDQTP
ncbi:MAG: CPBP family intramembrane metalloprotease [Phycisphaerales bacterium]|nr:CPBP family intramembrane metalloprotease [Phycisphaerales bacterium]